MSIEIEFSLDRARSAMEASQIRRSLFEDSVCQILPAPLELVIIGSVHVVVNCFVISFSSFRRSAFQKFSDFSSFGGSKPNRRMTKAKTISVVLMASIIDKKSPRRECRPEHRATDSDFERAAIGSQMC
jgi:hypothetical protein